MPPLSPRLKERIRRDFGPGSDAVISLLAAGDVEALRRALELGLVDWRDLLVAAGLADGDWPQVLDREL
jgi:hypothetical protein